MKPKKKPERRKLYFNKECLASVFDGSLLGSVVYLRKKWGSADEEFVELRPGEVIVSYEDLAKAWDATVDGVLAEHSSHFKALAKYLGLSPKSKGEK